MDRNRQVFFDLLRAGLWEKDVRLSSYEKIDFEDLHRLASEQSVVGLLAAGIEHVVDMKIAKKDVISFIGSTFQLEERNSAMNCFIGDLVRKMLDKGLNPLLIKGQGIAQCYSRPLWRASGDVDFLLSPQSYKDAKELLDLTAFPNAKENVETLEYCMTMESWMVELHGTLHCRLTKRLDSFLDKMQYDCCNQGHIRFWENGTNRIALPAIDIDIFVVFSHIVKHYFRGGVGLRQVCDWCRLIWTYNSKIDVSLLQYRLKEAGLMSEWQAFSALAVDWLGMPQEAMLLYSEKACWRRKAARIMAYIFETGNFGHNRNNSYYFRHSFLLRKFISLSHHSWDLLRQFLVFPLDSIIIWWRMVKIGIKAAKRGD